MIDKERIKAEAEAFFEWPSKEKTYVTTTSMLIFANVIAEMARAEEREACAKAVEARGKAKKNGEWKGNNHAASSFAECIRMRSNAGIHRADEGRPVE